VVVIINQFHTIGDLLFEMPIADKYISEGHKVLWAVMTHILPIEKHFPQVTFMDKRLLNIDYTRKDEYRFENAIVIPLRFTDSILNVPYADCMRSKYLYAGLPLETWRNLRWERDWENEKKLFYEVLGLSDGEEYNFINKSFRYDLSGQAEINIDNGLRNVEMQPISGFTILDWGMVIENATNIHTVSTATFYMMEILNLTAKEINLYRRLPDEKDFKNIEYLCSKNYIFH